MSSFLATPVVCVVRDPSLAPAPARASVAIGLGSPVGDSGVTRLDEIDSVRARDERLGFVSAKMRIPASREPP